MPTNRTRSSHASGRTLAGTATVSVTAETSLSCAARDAWIALGRRSTYLLFPGVSPGARATGPLEHALELPLVDRVDQTVTLAVGRAGGQGRHERRFALRGPLASVVGQWRIEPGEEGVRVRLSLAWEIAPAVKESAVNTLRSRSPLPIRTDADAILSRAVDEFFETRLAAQAGAYVDALCARVAGRPA